VPSQTCSSLRCTILSGECPVPTLARSTNSLLSGKVGRVTTIIHRTVRCASRARTNGRQRNQRATRGSSQRSPGHVGLSGVPRGSWLQWSSSLEKEGDHTMFMSGGAPDCLVRSRTEDNYCLPNGAPTAPSCLGAIKGTPSESSLVGFGV
jgi:hypothetical protein